MKHPSAIYNYRCHQHWIWGLSTDRWQQKVNEYIKELEGWKTPRVLTFLSEPLELLAAYMACTITQAAIFLGNPNWQTQERRSAQAIAKPHLLWTDQGRIVCHRGDENSTESGWIMIPTGGTSGQIKFAIHTWDTLSAAVSGMHRFFFGQTETPINSCCVLPLYHVSGLMQFMRSLLTGGTLAIFPFKTLLSGTSADSILSVFLHPQSDRPSDFFLSLVPTQLSRMLTHGTSAQIRWLTQFQCILLGGAPAPPQLLQQARHHHLKLAPTYGMTETGAQVMTLKPEQFLQGISPPGDLLPHIRLDLVSNPSGDRQMQWSGNSVYWGYYPQLNTAQTILTDDIAQWQRGKLQIKGRASRKIISGGENIYPEELESTLLAMTGIEDVYVFGMPDADWGEIAIAAYVTSDDAITDQTLKQYMKQTLAAYKCPKIWWRSPAIPRNLQGKVNLNALKEQWTSTSFCNARSMNASPTD